MFILHNVTGRELVKVTEVDGVVECKDLSHITLTAITGNIERSESKVVSEAFTKMAEWIKEAFQDRHNRGIEVEMNLRESSRNVGDTSVL
jgi:hypothetical protein